MEMAMAAASTSSAGCDAPDECSVDALVRRHAVDNTVIVTFGNARQRHFTANWVLTLQSVGVSAGILVGMMNMQPSDPLYVPFARALRGRGVGVYTVNSPQVKQAPQGGRWFHVAPLLRTGARLVLSDSDVVWLRDPVPYLRALEAAHPKLDFAVSTDAQGGTDGRRLGDELDVEKWRACGTSMNIGIMLFPGGARAGSLRAMSEATEHLSIDNNLKRVDQGPMNYRWKYGYRDFKWPRPLFAERDSSGQRLCGLVNGSVVGAVLPAAQFCNTLTHDVLRLWNASAVRPFALHATWPPQRGEAPPGPVLDLPRSGSVGGCGSRARRGS